MFIRKLLVAVVPVALLAMSAQSALAASYPIDNTNPYATGCAATGVPVFAAWTGTGVLTLKFSNGCVTAWAEFTCRSINGCTNFTLWAKRNDGASSTVWVTWPFWTIPNGVTVFTGQLFDAGVLATSACYQGYFGAPPVCTWAY